MTVTATVLDPVLVTGDPGRMNGDRQERPDPQVPERARRRTFTALAVPKESRVTTWPRFVGHDILGSWRTVMLIQTSRSLRALAHPLRWRLPSICLELRER